ncbi:unnamed protein product, partial [Durusdinium trenchii]
MANGSHLSLLPHVIVAETGKHFAGRTCYALRGHQTTPRVWEVAFGLGSPMPEQGGIFRAAISLDVTSQALPSAEAAASSQQSERGFVQELSTAAPNSDRWREK